MPLAQHPIFGHVAPRLTHEPDGRGVSRQHAAGAHKAGFAAGHGCNFSMRVVAWTPAGRRMISGDYLATCAFRVERSLMSSAVSWKLTIGVLSAGIALFIGTPF